MIKITGLNKYYSKGKANELHVINNVTLELENTGLVAFLGKSGCGKTTLLNVIGGLDKQDSGSISYDNLECSKYNMAKIDAYRQENIGYIFQNYLLIENMSVVENLRAALEIIGITDQEEQNKRIEYALKKVGLYRHRKKLAGRLSGGEMQRVSIARSLVKKCQMIIADEPTGNLDSENTIEIMNILKKISKTTLVLLVTHNEDIANAYADRIIKIKDGTITEDFINGNSGKYINKSDKKIYLKDLSHENLPNKNIKIDVYSDRDYEDIELKIIVKNDTIYFDTNKKCINTTETGISLVDEHYEQDVKIDEENLDFDISWFNNKKEKNILRNIKTALKNSFKHFWFATKKTKIFRFIFFLIGVIIAGCVISYANYLKIDDSEYQKADAYLIYNDNESKGIYVDKNPFLEIDNKIIYNLIDEGYIEDIYGYFQVRTNVEKNLNSSIMVEYLLNFYVYPYSINKSEKLLAGRIPTTKTDLVLSKSIADKIIKEERLGDYKDLMGYELNNMIVCGVNSSRDSSVYVSDAYYQINLLELSQSIYFPLKQVNENYCFGRSDEVEYTIVKGENIKGDNSEILISEQIANYYELEVGEDITFNWDSENLFNRSFKLVGTFDTQKANSHYGFICNDEQMLMYNVNVKIQKKDGLKQFKDCLSNTYLEADWDIFFVTKISDFEKNKNLNYKLSSGRLPDKNGEVLVNDHLDINIGDDIYIYSGARAYKVVGKYTNMDGINNLNILLGNEQTYLTSLVAWEELLNTPYSYKINKLSELKKKLSDQKIQVKKIYDYQYSLNEYSTKSTRLSLLISSLILLLIGVTYVYFSTRSKLINNVKDIGVYRSIGKTRLQIIMSYIADIFVETTMTSLLGYFLVMIGVIYINTKITILIGSGIVTVNYALYLLGALIIYAINILIGILPVVRLMRNTPSEINSKYDI